MSDSYDTLWELGPEENEKTILNMAQRQKADFLVLGILLLANMKRSYWSRNQHHSFKDFIEQLGIGSYSRMTRLADMAQLVLDGKLTAEEVSEIGVSKMSRLLPLLKKGEVSRDTIELAKTCPYRDLLVQLGKVKEDGGPVEQWIRCPRCGNEYAFNKSMLTKAENESHGIEADED